MPAPSHLNVATQRFMASTIRILVLSSTRKERDGIAEYTRQVFRTEFAAPNAVEFSIENICPANVLRAPFKGQNILHIQHEFFLFDALVGVSALLIYPYLWFWSKLVGFKIITTVHSTYNVDDLESALPHFHKFRFLFPLGSAYLRLHLWLVSRLSDRVLILSRVGLDNMRRVLGENQMKRRVRYVHLGNYSSNVQAAFHGVLKEKFGLVPTDKIFTMFGFAWPIKGYEYGILAFDILVNQRKFKDIRLFIVSGETGKATFPGGGQGETYIGGLKRLTSERQLEDYVVFTGYLENSDPVLEELFADTFCFVFPYLDRNFPSGAISTTLATGKPVIVTDIRCFKEYEALPCVPEKNPQALADRMELFLKDPGTLAKAAEVSRKNAELFRMENVFARHVGVYKEVLGQQSDNTGPQTDKTGGRA